MEVYIKELRLLSEATIFEIFKAHFTKHKLVTTKSNGGSGIRLDLSTIMILRGEWEMGEGSQP